MRFGLACMAAGNLHLSADVIDALVLDDNRFIKQCVQDAGRQVQSDTESRLIADLSVSGPLEQIMEFMLLSQCLFKTHTSGRRDGRGFFFMESTRPTCISDGSL